MRDAGAVAAMAHLAGEVVEVTLAGQAAGMRLLLAEMQALQRVMPGAGGQLFDPAVAQVLAAEGEAAYDNMPV